MRPETGPMKFGDDWTGVFIRGDNAGYYAMILRHTLDEIPNTLNPLDRGVLQGLLRVLEGSNEHHIINELQRLKDFTECVDESSN